MKKKDNVFVDPKRVCSCLILCNRNANHRRKNVKKTKFEKKRRENAKSNNNNN